MEATIKTLATKDDITDVRHEIVGVKEELANAIAKISEEVSESKADNIKWMFIFWIGQVATTIGFIMLFFKK